MKKKVLFLITKSNWGGAQRYVHDIATALDPNQYEAIVALGGAGELKTKLDEAGVRTIAFQSLQRDISITKEIRFGLELYKLLRKERPYVLHVNSSKAGGLGCLLGRIAFVSRVIFTAHGWAFNEDRPGWQKHIIKFFHWLTVLFSHQTIAVSEETKQQLRWPLPRNRWIVIHNGRQQTEYLDRASARTQLGIKENDFVTGTIGELHPVKQHEVMIRTVAQLRDSGQIITHVIIGAGEHKAALQDLITKLQLEQHVLLTGAIDEAARYLQAFDIYVQPSRSEALAYTVIEATQAGLPIIASDVGGIPEIISHNENGLLVPSGDVLALQNALRDCMDNESKRRKLARNAITTGEQFSFEKMLTRTLTVYDSSTTSSAIAASRAID